MLSNDGTLGDHSQFKKHSKINHLNFIRNPTFAVVGHFDTTTHQLIRLDPPVKILDTDDGARYLGEFAIGVNPYVTRPMLDALFDEKIAGSIHLTPGNAYDLAPNGNASKIHWDIVLVQTPQWGGGEIYFDGVLVRKDGQFVLDALQGLNPEALR